MLPGENGRGKLRVLLSPAPSNGDAVYTEITVTLAAQMEGCSGLAGCAELAIPLIVLSHRVGGQVSPHYHVSLLLEVLLQ